jgi:hypothetical protein
VVRDSRREARKEEKLKMIVVLIILAVIGLVILISVGNSVLLARRYVRRNPPYWNESPEEYERRMRHP